MAVLVFFFMLWVAAWSAQASAADQAISVAPDKGSQNIKQDSSVQNTMSVSPEAPTVATIKKASGDKAADHQKTAKQAMQQADDWMDVFRPLRRGQYNAY